MPKRNNSNKLINKSFKISKSKPKMMMEEYCMAKW